MSDSVYMSDCSFLMRPVRMYEGDFLFAKELFNRMSALIICEINEKLVKENFDTIRGKRKN